MKFNHLIWTPFLGIKYLTSTETYFRILLFEVSTITDEYLTLFSSSKICCMAKGAKTFTAIASHFVRPHEHFCICRFLVTEDLHSIDRREWLCLIVWNANNPSSAAMCLSSSVIVSLVKQDVIFWLQLILLTAIESFFFVVLQYIGPTYVFYREWSFAYGTEYFSRMLSSFIKGYSTFRFLVKAHFIFGIFMGFLFPTLHTSNVSRSYNDYTTHKLNWQCDMRQQRKLCSRPFPTNSFVGFRLAAHW
jgi:hypothetical protein